jgi:hypothetical protein
VVQKEEREQARKRVKRGNSQGAEGRVGKGRSRVERENKCGAEESEGMTSSRGSGMNR